IVSLRREYRGKATPGYRPLGFWTLAFLQPAPIGDEERHCLGDPAQGLKVDALVEAVDRLSIGAIDERRKAGIESEEARVCRERHSALLKGAPEYDAVGGVQRGDRLVRAR